MAVTEGLGEARCHLAWLLLLAIGCRLLLLCFCLVVAVCCYCLVLFVAIVYRLLLLFAVCYLFVLCVAIVCCLLLLVVVCCSCLLFIVHYLLYFLGVAYGCYNLLMLFDGFPCIGVFRVDISWSFTCYCCVLLLSSLALVVCCLSFKSVVVCRSLFYTRVFFVCFQSYHLLLFVNGMLILKLLLPSFIQNSIFLNNSSALLSDSS